MKTENVEDVKAIVRGLFALVAEAKGEEDDPWGVMCPEAQEGEWKLWEKVLQSIADGTASDPQEMAKAALQTCNLDINYYYS